MRATYADGATQGAPQAQQIADRWHLLKNLADTLTKSLAGYRRKLQQITIADSPIHQPPEPDEPNINTGHQERYQAYQTAVALAQQGMSQKAIAQQLNRHPRTIRRWLRAGEFPEIRRSGRKSMLVRSNVTLFSGGMKAVGMRLSCIVKFGIWGMKVG